MYKPREKKYNVQAIDDQSILRKIGWGILSKVEQASAVKFREEVLNRYPDEPAKAIIHLINWLHTPALRNDLSAKTVREQFKIFLPEDLPKEIADQISLYMYHKYKGFRPNIKDFSYNQWQKYIRAGLRQYYDFMWYDYFLGYAGFDFSRIISLLQDNAKTLWNDTASIRNMAEQSIPDWYVQFSNYLSITGLKDSIQDLMGAVEKLYSHPLEIPPKYSQLSRILGVSFNKAKNIWNYLFLFGLTVHLYYNPIDFGLAGQTYRGRLLTNPFLAFQDFLRSVPVKNLLHIMYVPVKYLSYVQGKKTSVQLKSLQIFQRIEVYNRVMEDKKFLSKIPDVISFVESDSGGLPEPQLRFDFALKEQLPRYKLSEKELKVLDLMTFGIKFSFDFKILSQISGIKFKEIKSIAQELLDRKIVRPYIHLHNLGLAEKFLLELHGDHKILTSFVKFLTGYIPIVAYYETVKPNMCFISMRLPHLRSTFVVDVLKDIMHKYKIMAFANYVTGGKTYLMTLLSRLIKEDGTFVEIKVLDD